MPVMSSSTPPKATDSPSVVRPPPRTVTGTACFWASRTSSATWLAERASSDDVGKSVGHAARVGEVEAARGPFAKLESRRPGLGGERTEALTLPARGQRLQALQEGQRVGGDGIGRQAAAGGRNLEGRAHADEILAEADRSACAAAG